MQTTSMLGNGTPVNAKKTPQRPPFANLSNTPQRTTDVEISIQLSPGTPPVPKPTEVPANESTPVEPRESNVESVTPGVDSESGTAGVQSVDQYLPEEMVRDPALESSHIDAAVVENMAENVAENGAHFIADEMGLGKNATTVELSEYLSWQEMGSPDWIDPCGGAMDVDAFQQTEPCLAFTQVDPKTNGVGKNRIMVTCNRRTIGGMLFRAKPYVTVQIKCSEAIHFRRDAFMRLDTHKTCIIFHLNSFYFSVYRSFLDGGVGCYLLKERDEFGKEQLRPYCDLEPKFLKENEQLKDALCKLLDTGPIRKLMTTADKRTLSASDRELTIKLVVAKALADREDPSILGSISFVKKGGVPQDWNEPQFSKLCAEAKMLDEEGKPLRGAQLIALAEKSTILGVCRAQPTPPSP